MSKQFALSGALCFLVTIVVFGQVIVVDPPALLLGPYEYEVKHDHEGFAGFNPRKESSPDELLL